MKVDEHIRSRLISNFEERIICLNKQMTKYLKMLKKARDVEQIMSIKKQMLIAYVGLLPITRSFCYFCLKEYIGVIDRCINCEYAKVHGNCFESNSDYAKLWDAYNKLLEAIESYYRGESYDNFKSDKRYKVRRCK